MEVLSKTEITGEKAIKKGISIIVCTFNGSSRLAQTIQHVAAQVVRDQIQWEVIFVDNASTDNSTEVVGKEWTKHGPKDVELSLLKEERPGKIFALEQAFSTAKYEYAIICDDDNWLNPDYLELAYEILEQDDSIGAVGGRSAAKNDSGIFPVWFDNFTESYAVGEQALSTGDVTDDRGYLWGGRVGHPYAHLQGNVQWIPVTIDRQIGRIPCRRRRWNLSFLQRAILAL